MKITYEKLITYGNYATNWLSKEENKNTKLAYAIERFGKKYPKYIKEYQEVLDERQAKINDAYTDFASEDKDKNIDRLIVKNDKGEVTYTENKYTRENKKLCDNKIISINKEYNNILSEFLSKEVEIETYYCSSIPSNLSFSETEAFTGIIIESVLKINHLNGQEKHLQEA